VSYKNPRKLCGCELDSHYRDRADGKLYNCLVIHCECRGPVYVETPSTKAGLGPSQKRSEPDTLPMQPAATRWPQFWP
jgi:hypothetical protein